MAVMKFPGTREYLLPFNEEWRFEDYCQNMYGVSMNEMRIQCGSVIWQRMVSSELHLTNPHVYFIAAPGGVKGSETTSDFIGSYAHWEVHTDEYDGSSPQPPTPVPPTPVVPSVPTGPLTPQLPRVAEGLPLDKSPLPRRTNPSMEFRHQELVSLYDAAVQLRKDVNQIVRTLSALPSTTTPEPEGEQNGES